MAFPSKLLALVLVTFLSSPLLLISARILDSNSPLFSRLKVVDSKSTLITRLKLDQEEPNSCWDALLELQSCTSEVVLFFLNGETHLGDNCCTAIRTIERHCWPSMLGTIGITSEESDVLRGYCNAADDGGATPTTTAPPPAPLSQYCYNFPRLPKP